MAGAAGGVFAGDIGHVLANRDRCLFVVGGQNLRRGDDVDVRIGLVSVDDRADVGEIRTADFDSFLQDAKRGTSGHAARSAFGNTVDQAEIIFAEAAAQRAGLIMKAAQAAPFRPYCKLFVYRNLHDQGFEIDHPTRDVNLLDNLLQGLVFLLGSGDDQGIGFRVGGDFNIRGKLGGNCRRLFCFCCLRLCFLRLPFRFCWLRDVAVGGILLLASRQTGQYLDDFLGIGVLQIINMDIAAFRGHFRVKLGDQAFEFFNLLSLPKHNQRIAALIRNHLQRGLLRRAGTAAGPPDLAGLREELPC